MTIWEPTPERERISFSECEILVEQKISINGNGYNKIIMNLFPLDTGKQLELITATYLKFSDRTQPWDSDVLPAIRQLVTAGKISNAPDIDGKWVSWKWGAYRTYRKNDIFYWENRAKDEAEAGDNEASQKSAANISTDDHGKKYVEKRYVHLLDIFANEDEARKANDAHYGTDPSAAGNDTPPTGLAENDDGRETNATFLPLFVGQANVDGTVDLVKLAKLIESQTELKAYFTVDSPEVLAEIAKIEGTKIPSTPEEDELPF